MSPTYRIFEKDSTISIATAVRTKAGIFQVKPEKKGFATLEEWIESVGLGNGRRLETEGENPKLTADQMFVAKAVARALQAELHCKKRAQYLCYPSLQKQMDDAMWRFRMLEENTQLPPIIREHILSSHNEHLARLRAQAAANPSQLNEPTYWMATNPKPLLYVKADDGFLPIYYSKDFKKVSIRLTNGNLVDSFYEAGINTDYALPVFYAMTPQQVLMPVPSF
jgi:hypothetical protein